MARRDPGSRWNFRNWHLFKRYLYLNYRYFYVFGRWVQMRFSPEGRLFLVLTGVTGALGADTNASVTYQAFSILALMMLSSFFLNLFRRRKIMVRRILPPMASAGAELIFPVEVRIRSRRPVEGVFIAEYGPDPRPSFEEFVHIREPGEENRNWVDRMYAYYRWKWLLERKRQLRSDNSRRFTLFGDRVNNLQMKLTPLKRGFLELKDAVIGLPDPLGLTFALHFIREPQKILVLPEQIPMNHYEFPGSSSPETGILAQGSSGGAEEEFINLRDYRPGDALKQIHWNSSARARKLIVREYQTSSRARCGIILDVHAPVARAFDFEKLVTVAASLAGTGQRAGVDLDFLFVGDEAYCFSSGPGRGEMDQLMEILATVQYASDDNWPSLVRVVQENTESLQGATFLTMTWDEERKSMARYLRLQGVPFQVFVMNDGRVPESDQPSMDGEIPEVCFLHPDSLKERLSAM